MGLWGVVELEIGILSLFLRLLSCLAHSQWMVKSRVISELQEACWDMVSAMAGDIILLLDSDNDGVRTHAIKFVEGLIVTLSPRLADSEVPRRQEHDISLDRIPRDHPYIQYSECRHQLVPSVCHCTCPCPLPSPLLLVFNFCRQYSTAVKSPDTRFKSQLQHLLVVELGCDSSTPFTGL